MTMKKDVWRLNDREWYQIPQIFIHENVRK